VCDSKYVIIFDPLFRGYLIGACAVAANVLSMVTVGDFVTNNSRMDRPRIFKLGGVVPCDLLCVTTIQGQKVKVVNYRKPPNGKTNSKNAITQQRMIISASNLVKMVIVGDKMS